MHDRRLPYCCSAVPVESAQAGRAGSSNPTLTNILLTAGMQEAFLSENEAVPQKLLTM